MKDLRKEYQEYSDNYRYKKIKAERKGFEYERKLSYDEFKYTYQNIYSSQMGQIQKGKRKNLSVMSTVYNNQVIRYHSDSAARSRKIAYKKIAQELGIKIPRYGFNINDIIAGKYTNLEEELQKKMQLDYNELVKQGFNPAEIRDMFASEYFGSK